MYNSQQFRPTVFKVMEEISILHRILQFDKTVTNSSAKEKSHVLTLSGQ